jgi:hypothetical protein
MGCAHEDASIAVDVLRRGVKINPSDSPSLDEFAGAAGGDVAQSSNDGAAP